MLSDLPSQLDGFAGLIPGLMLSVASRKTMERGLQYLQFEAVESLWWDSEQQALGAKVQGSQLYTVGLRPISESKLLHSCTCPAHGKSDGCKHVVAVLAAMFAITQERNFTRKPPDWEYLQDLFEGILHSLPEDDAPPAPSSTKAAGNGRSAKKDGPRLYLVYNLAREEFTLETDGIIPMRLAQWMGLHFPGNSPGSRACGLDPYYGIHDLIEKVRAAAKWNVPVYYECDDGRDIRLTGQLRPVPALVSLNARAGDRRLEHGIIPLDETTEEPAKVVLDLNERTFLAENGDLLTLDEQRDSLYLDLAQPSFYSFDSFGRVQEKSSPDIAIAEFNARSLMNPNRQLPEDLRYLWLLQDGDAGTVPLDPATPDPYEIVVEISPGKTELEITTKLRVDDEEIPLDQVASILAEHGDGGGIHLSLMSAKGRVKTLVETGLRLPLLPGKKERAQLVKETVETPLFQRLKLTTAARKWLKPFQNANLTETSAANSVCLLAVPGSDKPWRCIASPLPRLMHLWLGLVRPEKSYHFHSMGPEISLDCFTPAKKLPEINLLCAAVGARLQYKGQEIENRPVEIRVQFEAGKEIDWFELRPEIRCGSLTIPHDQWEDLILGRLLLRDDGKLVLPQLSQAQALEQLQAVFGQKPKSKKRKKSSAAEAAQQVPRLQMLDWIAMRKQGIEVNLPKEAEELFESLRSFDTLQEQPLPKTLKATLRDYQRRGFEWLQFLYQHRFGACLADDMGLGKTLQAIALLAWRKSQSKRGQKRLPHLAVVPPTLVFNWQSEIEKFCPTLSTSEYIGGSRDLKTALKTDVLITTYDIARRDIEQLRAQKFDIVIFDETQTVKNLAAARTKAVVKLDGRFTLCLTGTPMENHAGEYYSIMNLALPGIFGDYDEFRHHLRQENNPQADLLLARARPFVLRRTKEKILTELPPKVESDLHLDMTDEQKEIYTRTVAEVREEVLEAYQDKTKAQAGIVALSALTRLRQVCISPEILGKPITGLAPKIEYLRDQLQELQDEGHAVLVFSQFTRVLDLLETHLAGSKLSLLRLDGQTPTKKRKALVQAFQQGENTSIFLISLKAGGVGLNLTRANYVYHVDPWWNPAVEKQAADRAHRMGQTQTVFIQRLLMRHTIEEKMMALKAKKQALFDALIEAPQAKSKGGSLITRDDFEFLLGD